MRHQKMTVKLGRKSEHRGAMLAAQVCSLIRHGRIRTTVPKARASRRLAERSVTLGKRGTLAARRLALSRLHAESAVKKLFETVAPAFADRKGGYTRIVRIGRRGSDSGEMAFLEWTNYVPPAPKAPKAKSKKSEETSSGEGK
ncbi:MAG: 50S ribosomal protein L17 [Kiritimatiellae bacterium]|nr:50S ribosomal protein L17 [Kiritimatiellia bacterium]